MDDKTTERNTGLGTRSQFEPALLAESLPTDAGLSFTEARDNKARQRAIYVARLTNDVGPRYGPDRATFSTFQLYDKRQKPALAMVVNYADRIAEHAQSGHGLVLYGSVGTGKDHLLAATLYRACADGYRARWFSCQDFYGRIRDRMDFGPEEEILATVRTPDVLGLSDPTPPAGELSPWRNELLYRIVDRRYHACKPTLVTINAATTEEVEAKLGSQVWDRLQEGATVVACLWPSFRER